MARTQKLSARALGLTPVLNPSGESNRVGRISLCVMAEPENA
jgi:hypothetical protein